MKIKQLLVLCALTAMNLCAMELEHRPSAIELLPNETKLHIFDYLDCAPTIEQALQNIQNIARVNQYFSRLLNDQRLTKKFIDRLIKNFPEQTQKDRILAALYLNTTGSRIWLNKNHPEWKEFAKNLAKKILDRFIDEPNDAPIINALLNVPEIADYTKNYKDDRGDAALMLAAISENPAIVEKLLAAGAQPNVKNEYGYTALHYAAKNGLTAIVEKLLAAGADFNITDNNGRTALIEAALGRYTTVIEKLLLAGAKPNMKDKDGLTALSAATYEHTVVEKLLALGADPTIKNKYGWTALDFARKDGDAAVIKLLRAAMKKAIS